MFFSSKSFNTCNEYVLVAVGGWVGGRLRMCSDVPPAERKIYSKQYSDFML